MNSDKAAAVRDSVNGCPTVVDPESDVIERDKEPREMAGGEIRTGDRVTPSRCHYRPAYIDQSGTLEGENGQTRPVYVVVLETLWTESSDVRSLPRELVYEVAKHDCRLRFYPPDHRLDGDIWITDHFSEDLTDADGDRCGECGGTYWKLRDGDPECAKCGAAKHSGDASTGPPTIEDYT